MTKLEKLKAAVDAAHKAVVEAAYARDRDHDVAVEAYNAIWAAYEAELKIQEGKPMTKLEELYAAWEDADDRARDAYRAVTAAEDDADAAEDAADDAWRDYQEELRRHKRENPDD